jgi:hypothetical protein
LQRLAESLPAGEAWIPLQQAVKGLGLGLEASAAEGAVEERLMALDEEALDRAEDLLDEAAAAALDEDLSGALARLRTRLPAVELEAARQRLRRDLLRRRFALPLLSLFSPAAESSEQTPAEPAEDGDDPGSG